MIAIVGTYAVVGVVILAFAKRLGRRAFVVGAVPFVVTLAWLLPRLADVVDGEVFRDSVTWVAQLDLVVDLRVDAFAATMTLVIAAVGLLVLWYGLGYFTPESADVGRLAGLLVLFAGAMVGLVQSDNFYIFFTFWELTSITSFLLIGSRFIDARARAAALHALLVTGGGGLAMLAGFVLVTTSTGVSRLSDLDTIAPSGTLLTVAMVLLLVGAFTKSAQYPFHAWLPGAMAAPTPVSAYLHSATMVTAGVYLIARIAPTFASVPSWRPIVFAIGGLTIVAGGIHAIRQRDAKLLLAYGTVSQLGFMVVLFGAGTTGATVAGWLLLVAQALFKAALFMVVGVVDRTAGTRDLRQMPPLGRDWWWLEAATLVAVCSMAGVPLTAGFIAKEADFEAFADAGFGGHWLVLAIVVGGSVFTAAYSAKLYWQTFPAPRRRARAAGADALQAVAAPAWSFGAPAALLAAACLVLGLIPGIEDALLSASIDAIRNVILPVHLAIWHGVNLELVLSLFALGAGVLMFAVINRRPVRRLDRTGRTLVPSAEHVYLRTLRAVGTTSRRVTGVVQNGSLPVYTGVILLTAVALPTWVLLTEWDWTAAPELVSHVGDIPLVAFLVTAALGAAVVRRRFAAALFLGATGYAMAALFVAYGAPDLALTQVAVETLSTVVFVLVLRRLPERFERQSTSRRRVLRAGIAGAVGAAVFVFAIAASSDPLPPTVSDQMTERAVPDGHGSNVVNVILVDFRGLDTLGEITVLATAAIGAAALARVGLRARGERGIRRPDPADDGDADQRLVFVDVTVQVMFVIIVMTSLWLLFAGHNQPGGGFVGGLLAGSAIALRYIAGGIREVRERSRFKPWIVLGTGLLLAALAATVPLLFGDPVLDIAYRAVELPVFGGVKLSSALVFDVGVYITVLGMVLMAFEAFGEERTEVAP